MEVEEDVLDIEPYRRVRVLLDITKPLRRFQRIKLRGDIVVKVDFKYERSPFFCFLCGSIFHNC